jgi:hypothetical protein
MPERSLSVSAELSADCTTHRQQTSSAFSACWMLLGSSTNGFKVRFASLGDYRTGSGSGFLRTLIHYSLVRVRDSSRHRTAFAGLLNALLRRWCTKSQLTG